MKYGAGQGIVHVIAPEQGFTPPVFEIDPRPAEVVRRIHSEFADRHSAIDIARRRNAEGVPSPRDGEWN